VNEQQELLHPKFIERLEMKLRCLLVLWCVAYIGLAQAEEAIADNVRNTLQRSVSDHAALKPAMASQDGAWLDEMSRRLQKLIPNIETRTDFLMTLYYEATRAGLDPQLVLALIDVKSGFNRQSVSPTGAQGYMSLMALG